MRLSKLWFFLVVAAMTMAVAVFVMHRYNARPFFVGNFRLFGHGFLVNWETYYPLTYDDKCVYYDRRERVLFVVPTIVKDDNCRDELWEVVRTPMSDLLHIRRTTDGLTKEVEWRRDCVISVDREGVPTYASMSVRDFANAFSTPWTMTGAIEDIVSRSRIDDAASQPAQSGSAKRGPVP